MKKVIQTVRGMHDILPEQIAAWEQLESTVASVMASYAYQQVRTPVLEREELILRPVGEHSDIVQKELYRYESSDGSVMVMRPEGTVPTVRALANANATNQPSRTWYLGPMFRHERPQKGRLRQFHQFGAELLGVDDPSADIEIILLCWRLWQQLGIADKVELQVNNLGRPAERTQYKEVLTDYLTKDLDKLGELDQTRVAQNPLRVLDSKDPALVPIIKEAPTLQEFLSAESQQHFAQVLTAIQAAQIPVTENPQLIRGLDYYNLTVFEWVEIGADRRQNAVAGGGRYDGLAAMIGGNDVPGTGMAAGMERLLQLGACHDAQALPPRAFLATSKDALELPQLLSLAEAVRNAGVSVQVHLRKDKIKNIFKHADSSGARYAVVIGPKEASSSQVTVKDLRGDAEQQTIEQTELANFLSNL